jgi:pimeloyl-ACP methyl ester carboxylesterase
MGAALGIVFATTYPGLVRNLVVCDTIACSPINAGTDDTFGPRIEAARRDGDMVRTSGETLQRWFGEAWLDSHADEAARLRTLLESTQVEGFVACCSALRSDTFDLRPLAGKLSGAVEHVRFVVGENDADLPVKMRDLEKGTVRGFELAGKRDETVEYCVIPAAGHVSFIDGEEHWLKAVLPFLKE